MWPLSAYKVSLEFYAEFDRFTSLGFPLPFTFNFTDCFLYVTKIIEQLYNQAGKFCLYFCLYCFFAYFTHQCKSMYFAWKDIHSKINMYNKERKLNKSVKEPNQIEVSRIFRETWHFWVPHNVLPQLLMLKHINKITIWYHNVRMKPSHTLPNF